MDVSDPRLGVPEIEGRGGAAQIANEAIETVQRRRPGGIDCLHRLDEARPTVQHPDAVKEKAALQAFEWVTEGAGIGARGRKLACSSGDAMGDNSAVCLMTRSLNTMRS